MKKRLFAFILSLAALFSFASCSAKETSLVLSFDESACDYGAVSDCLRERLTKLYISESNAEVQKTGYGIISVRVHGTSLSDEQLKILLFSGSLSVKDSEGNTVMDRSDFADCGVDFDPSMPDGTGENGCFVRISFTEEGAAKFRELTRRLTDLSGEKQRTLYFYAGEKLVYSPVIQRTVISTEIMLTGIEKIEECILSSAQIYSAIKPLPCLVEVKLE